MLNDILNDLTHELKFGYLKKKHPFRYFSLASFTENTVNQRTVVLREITDQKEILIYTDYRSKKVKEFSTKNKASALFYHPKKLLQIQVCGSMQIITSGKEHETHWNKMRGNSTKDFITQLAPGTPIKNPDNVEYKENEHHFCLLKLKTDTIEYLELKRPNHIRARFKLNGNSKWEGQFLNP